MDRLIKSVEFFLEKHCDFSLPLLLALSGGPDSLFLFYALLRLREKQKLRFAVAHVDHGWRIESRAESARLQALCASCSVSFYLKILDPKALQGNLEAACRDARYAFFQELIEKEKFDAVLTGHHLDDRAETVLKRILEGAHWSSWVAIKAEQNLKGLRILRPLINLRKKELENWLQKENIEFFLDSTNLDSKHLRSRMRHELLPSLAHCFGKEINDNLAKLSSEMEELNRHFDQALSFWIQKIVHGPFGLYLDLQTKEFLTEVEAKYFIRFLAKQKSLFLSQEIVAQAARALIDKRANLLFCMGKWQLHVDRKRLFLVFARQNHLQLSLHLDSKNYFQPASLPWKINFSKVKFLGQTPLVSDWKMAWSGCLHAFLPIDSYDIVFGFEGSDPKTKKQWSQAKVPAFLYSYFPFILRGNEGVLDFLSGKSPLKIRDGEECFKLELEPL